MLIRLALCFSCCFFTGIAQAQIPTNGLVAHWPFTGNANDVSGNVLHGNMANITPVKGKLGVDTTAYSFNNVNSQIGIPYQSTMNVPVISMCAVFKADAFYTGNCQGNFMISRGLQGSSGSLVLSYFDNAYNDCTVTDTNSFVFSGHVGTIISQGSLAQSTTRVHTNTWYCFIMTFDGISTKFYVDGILVNTITGWSSTIGSSTDSICIGKYPWGGTSYPYNFIGALDDVAIYDHSLSTAEIDSYCTNAPKVGIPVDTGDSNVTVWQINDIPNAIKLHPNPNNGSFTINGTLNSESAEVIIYNLVGTVMYKSKVSVKSTVISKDIDMAAVPGGVYLLKINAGNYSKNIRFVKQE